MRVEIIGLSQEMDLRDGTFKNVLRLQFLDNTLAQVIVEDAVVTKVTELFVKHGGAAVASALSGTEEVELPQQFTQPAQSLVLDDEGNEDFGGNYGDEQDQAVEEYETREEPVPVPAARATTHKRALQVSADERGNPIISGRNVRDTESVLGGRGADQEEDGVGSV
jgi:hypothetical protein